MLSAVWFIAEFEKNYLKTSTTLSTLLVIIWALYVWHFLENFLLIACTYIVLIGTLKGLSHETDLASGSRPKKGTLPVFKFLLSKSVFLVVVCVGI
jgi:hypothetical protein